MSINALHAMESSGGQLTISTSNKQFSEIDARLLGLSVGDYILLSITDTGCGMDLETRERVFDPFYSTKGNRGTGLGLSQVYGFVNRSGGVISVHSELGCGSCFSLYFPRSQQSTVETTDTLSSKLLAPKIGAHKTLLVVDDEPALVNLACAMFTAQGYQVLTANDGVQALEVLEKAEIESKVVDLIVSDVIMPNMDGYQLAEKVQQRYPRIKLLMVSGFADDRHINGVDSTLYDNILYKPYTSADLLERVKALLL